MSAPGPSKKFSGAEFRKRAKEKAEKEEELVKKIRKLDTFFLTSPSPQNIGTASSSTSALVSSCVTSEHDSGPGSNYNNEDDTFSSITVDTTTPLNASSQHQGTYTEVS